jgi:hypothetical protein
MDTVFLSLGNPYKPEYQDFAEALEKKCEELGIALKSVGYNVGTHGRPLMKVIEILDQSKGAVIVAFKRLEVASGSEKGKSLPAPVYVTTPWNHIEAAMAYDRGLPMLVLVETGLKLEGVLEKGNDWYVHEMDMQPASLQDKRFKLLFSEWREALKKPRKSLIDKPDLEQITLVSLFSNMKVMHLIGLIATLITLLFVAFEWGMHVAGK